MADCLSSVEALRYLLPHQPPFGEVNDLSLFLFEFQSSLFLVAVSVPILGLPFLLSAVITGSMKIHPREVLLTHNSL